MDELELEAYLDDQWSEHFRTDADWAVENGVNWEVFEDRRMN
jgi:hypothetical protein